MTDLDCNVIDNYVTIISICTVSVTSNVTVHWYYSQERDSAGVNGSILPGIHQGISVNLRCILGHLRLSSAQLSITTIRTLDEGYYWCEVDVEESQGLVRRPSSVLRISGCDTLSLCTTQSFHTNIICALSDTGSDIARTNLTFVDLYSDSCPPGPTTPERVTIAEEGSKLSTSTLGAVPTITSKLSTKFEKTTMSSAIPITTTTITDSSSSSSSGSSNWASEASPTLGCSIEISRDIYIAYYTSKSGIWLVIS